ncbi:tetratricopeptide repeat protein [Aureisphaera sp. CAU 1614]|uniref:Tetratricopeptide repeat protein n=1 Tax=Halomarinibacterium sedimenti TaxID=2857106 RepID=A0A9X1FQ26_9FLAO|nr:tetratricopeptide repeat protein [Halomarinibacterium sedimenti]
MRYLLIGFLLFFSCGLFAQNDLLAKNYFEQGDYEKALVLYKRLVQQNKGNTRYLVDLVKTHQQLEQYSEAEELLKEYTEGKRIIPQFLIELGYNYALQNKDSISQINYQKAIDFVKESPPYAYIVGQVFSDYNLLNEAVTVYETAMMQDDSRNYYAQLARIYGEQGELEKMFETYVELIKINPTYNGTIKRNFSLYITEDPTNEANILLRKTLLKKLQQDPDVLYNELLSWLFIQQKDFKKAFIQEKAIYARREENLSGLLDLGKITIDEKSYEDAKEIINFIIEKAYNPRLKLEGYQQLMYVELELAQEKDYPKIDAQYKQLFSEFGDDRDTYLLQIDYNDFLAFRYGKKEEAIQNLKALSKKGLTIYQEARVKLKLADILVFDEKFNEALIYYSQVQNKVQNDVLAQEARFKVARTSYFKGDFEWAQVQLDVLKKSASQLIANDAMQLSLMIQDNSLEDSTQTALKKFATADLRALQNKNVEAITLLKDILTNHKGEEIEDEALLKMGMIYEKLNQFENAEAQYLKLIELYKEDILADDAHFKLAKLYETYLGQPEKAKELYEQIIFNFQDSIYFVEARKRYRMLRGDEIN